ncbi:MAG: hypothetical protein ACKOI1_01050, partial [Bacteroidota bacterium]
MSQFFLKYIPILALLNPFRVLSMFGNASILLVGIADTPCKAMPKFMINKNKGNLIEALMAECGLEIGINKVKIFIVGLK